MDIEKLYGLETTDSLIRQAEQTEPHRVSSLLVDSLVTMLKRYRQFYVDVTDEDFMSDVKNLSIQYPNEPILNLFESHLSALKTAEMFPK